MLVAVDPTRPEGGWAVQHLAVETPCVQLETVRATLPQKRAAQDSCSRLRTTRNS